MRSDKLEDVLIDAFQKYFKDAVRDCAVTQSTDQPYLQLTIEMTFYNYFIVRTRVEMGTIFFSILQSGFQLQLFKSDLSGYDLGGIPSKLDEEIRLRIPDKYLERKGW